jgi:hypothetical protein
MTRVAYAVVHKSVEALGVIRRAHKRVRLATNCPDLE